MIDFIINIKNFILNILTALVNLVIGLIKHSVNFIASIKDIKKKLINLKSINFDLVDYHLTNGNVGDAILRLKIINNFIAPDDKLAQYKLAWCYFIKTSFDKAIDCLGNCGDFDTYGLKKYLQLENVQAIPENILMEYKNISSKSYCQIFGDKKFEVASNAVKLFAKHQKSLAADFQILDLASVDGVIAKALDSCLHKKYTLTGIESSTVMYKILQDTQLYDYLELNLIYDFLSNNIKQYDAIFSFCGLSFKIDFTEVLDVIIKSLKSRGYFVITFITATTNHIDITKTQFFYDVVYMEQLMQNSQLHVLETSKLSCGSLEYMTLLCQLI